MSRASNSAQMAGTTLDRYIGYLTTITDVTQKSAASVGESLKTVYSRYQNIAAGKFVAAQSDIDSENYDEASWQGLNDVEKALKALGINIRSSVDTFRNFDDVMDEIASKWSTFSDVQKSGIATSLAGTRQRENLLTLFENWDLVSKYEQISENAYGTAAKKMEAYSDSVEAAKTRISAAVEKFVISLNASDGLKKFYGIIAGLAENFSALSTVLTLTLVWINRGNLVTSLSAGAGKLVGTMGRMASYINNQQIANSVLGKGSGNYIANGWNLAMDNAQETYMASVRQSYQQGISNFIDKMSGVSETGEIISTEWKTMMKAGILPLQQTLLGLSDAQRQQIASVLTLTGLNEAQALEKAKSVLTENDTVMIQALLNMTTEQERAQIEQRLTSDEQANESSKNLAIAQNKLASLINSKQGQYLGRQLDDYGKINPKKAIYSGAASMVGSMAGAYVGGSVVNSLGINNQLVTALGTMGGMAVGSKAGTALTAGIAAKVGGAGMAGVLSAATPVGIVAIGAMALAGVLTAINKYKKSQQEKAQKEATEFINDYQDKLSASTNVSKYDELAKRVDQFGRNVSLTDEDYQDFLDISNELAEKFPDLVVRTDEYGNSFLGVEGKVKGVTEALEEQIKTSQRAADMALIDENVAGVAFKDAKKEQKSNQKKEKELESRIAYLQDRINRGGYSAASGQPGKADIFYADSEKQTNEFRLELEQKQKELSQIKNQLGNDTSMSDYNDAVYRLNSQAQAIVDNLDEDTQILIKQTFSKAANQLDKAQYENWDKYEEALNELSENIASFYQENPVLVELQTKMEDSNSADEYNEARDKVLQALIKSFGEVSTWDDTTKKFVISLGFKIDDNILEKYKEQGYMDKLPKNINLGKYSMADLKTGYTLLGNGREFDSESSFQQAIMYDQIKGKGLQDIANMYKQYINTDEVLTPSQVIKKRILEGQLDEWAKEIGVVKSNYKDVSKYYDDIIKKAKIYGNLDKSGMTSETPEEVKTRMDKYAKYYKFMRDEYSKTGKWDIDTYNEMLSDKEIQPYLANNDTKGLTKYLQDTLKDAPNIYKNAYQQVLWDNEDINEQMQKDHKDVYDQFNEDYNIDLTKFETLNAAKEWIDSYTNSVLSSDWETWVSDMETYYQEDLAKFTNATQQKLAMNKLILTQQLGMSKTQSSQWTQGWTQVYEDMGGSDYYGVDIGTFLNQKAFEEAQSQATDSLNGTMDKWAQGLTEGLQKVANLIPGGSFKLDTLDDGTSNLKNAEDYLSALEGIYQKEYYLRKSYKDFGNINAGSEAAYMNSTYYAGLKQVYQLESQYYASKLPKGKKVTEYSKDQLGYLQKYQEVQIKLNNLDDEEWEDRINILELQGASLEKLIAANKEYEKTSDTLQEHIERQKKILELEIQQLELHKEVSEWQRDNTDRLIDRLSGDAYGNDAYDRAINQQVNAINDEIADTQSIIQKYYAKAVDAYEQTGHTHAEALRLAYTGNNDYSKELRSAMTDYYNLIDKRTEYTIKKMEDKADDLNRRLDLIEKEKPQEWFKIGDIDSYYTQRMDLLQKQVELYQDALKDTSDMTDEQIQNIVDSLNEATLNLKEAQIDNLKDQTDLQSKQYDAIVYRINLWKDEIQDAIDAIEKAYEDEIKPIQDINDELERQGKLEDLLAAKKAAQREKERVFREGIGWVTNVRP